MNIGNMGTESGKEKEGSYPLHHFIAKTCFPVPITRCRGMRGAAFNEENTYRGPQNNHERAADRIYCPMCQTWKLSLRQVKRLLRGIVGNVVPKEVPRRRHLLEERAHTFESRVISGH